MFKLLIECTKDIEKLHIDFSDGTSVIQEKSEKPEKPVKERSEKINQEFIKQSKKETYLDTDSDFGSISQDIVKKPVIDEYNRPVNVANELQNFNF